MKGLLSTYNKSRSVSKSLNEYHRTGKTKKEREGEPIEDDRVGFLNLFVISTDTEYKPVLPLSGYTVPSVVVKDDHTILYKLLHSKPQSLFYLDVATGKTVLGESYGVEVAKTQLISAGVIDQDVAFVLDHLSQESVPAYFNLPVLTSILSSAGFTGFVYSSPFDKHAFVCWSGLESVSVLSYSLDGGKTWIDV